MSGEGARSGETADAGGGGAPEADASPFLALCIGLSVQVQVALGMRPNPSTGKDERDLPAAKRGIDVLDALEAKTKGNLDADESAFLAASLYDLRMAYVRAVRVRA